jgi:hypothetical protein
MDLFTVKLELSRLAFALTVLQNYLKSLTFHPMNGFFPNHMGDK